MEFLDLWPLLLGTYPALFAAGWAIGRKRAEKEAANDLYAVRKQHSDVIQAIRDQYKIEGPILLRTQPAKVEH